MQLNANSEQAPLYQYSHEIEVGPYDFDVCFELFPDGFVELGSKQACVCKAFERQRRMFAERRIVCSTVTLIAGVLKVAQSLGSVGSLEVATALFYVDSPVGASSKLSYVKDLWLQRHQNYVCEVLPVRIFHLKRGSNAKIGLKFEFSGLKYGYAPAQGDLDIELLEGTGLGIRIDEAMAFIRQPCPKVSHDSQRWFSYLSYLRGQMDQVMSLSGTELSLTSL